MFQPNAELCGTTRGRLDGLAAARIKLNSVDI
jgi:hypothetical protein